MWLNQKARLEFAEKHLNWTSDDWKRVLFTDETKINSIVSDGVVFIHRPKGKRLHPKYVRPTVKHGGGSIMIWGCIYKILGILNKYEYVDILERIMLPYVEWEMLLKFIYQQDNDPKHTSKFAKD